LGKLAVASDVVIQISAGGKIQEQENAGKYGTLSYKIMTPNDLTKYV